MRYSLRKGYVSLRRKWRAGDTIELDLPMPPRRVLASADVGADSNLSLSNVVRLYIVRSGRTILSQAKCWNWR